MIFNVLNLFHDYWFITKYNLGIIASPVATAIAQSMSLLVLLARLRRKVPIRWVHCRWSSFSQYFTEYGGAALYLVGRTLARVSSHAYCSRRSVSF